MTGQLGLELKARFAQMLLEGVKTVELRRYAIPDSYLGQPVLLLATPDGNEGVSTLPDDMPAGHAGVRIAGTVVFSGQVAYRSFEQFAADEGRHRVAPSSPYAWVPGHTQVLYGWIIESAKPASQAQQQAGCPAMQRVLSSWFEAGAGTSDTGAASGQGRGE